VNEQNNVQIFFIFSCVVKSKLFKNGCVVIICFD